METDTIFYRLFQSFPSIFFELIEQPPTLANTYQFSSVEVKQLSFRLDGVFLPQQDNDPIYFVEVQFQRDTKFYSRFFAEIFLYLDKTELNNNWRGVVVYPSRKTDSGLQERYEEILSSTRIQRIYLDQLQSESTGSLGLETVKLLIEPEATTSAKARELVEQAKTEIADSFILDELLQLIATIVIYKFPQRSWEEVRTMLGLTRLQDTRVYQDGVQQGLKQAKLETIPKLRALGLTVEQIAEALELDVKEVQKALSEQSS